MFRFAFVVVVLGMMTVTHAQKAEACGLRMIRTSKVRATKRSSNPSTILLLNTSNTKRLAWQLKKAGHKVEVATKANNAKRKSYGLVMTTSILKKQVEKTFPGSLVVLQQGSSRLAIQNVEKSLARDRVDSKGRKKVGQGGNRERVVGAGSQ